jgi:hypothetical protein
MGRRPRHLCTSLPTRGIAAYVHHRGGAPVPSSGSERRHHQRMKSSPGQSIETGRDTGFENAGRIVHLSSFTCRSIKYRMIKSHAAIVGPRIKNRTYRAGPARRRFKLDRLSSKIGLNPPRWRLPLLSLALRKPSKNDSQWARRFGWRATHGNPWKGMSVRQSSRSAESLARSSWQIFRLLIIDESERSRNNFKRFALGWDAPAQFDQCSQDHCCRKYKIT